MCVACVFQPGTTKLKQNVNGDLSNQTFFPALFTFCGETGNTETSIQI